MHARVWGATPRRPYQAEVSRAHAHAASYCAVAKSNSRHFARSTSQAAVSMSWLCSHAFQWARCGIWSTSASSLRPK